MPRKLKPHVVDTVTDSKTGATAEILFDRDAHDFFVVVGDHEERADTAIECKKKARALLKEWVGEKWESFISVDYSTNDHRLTSGSFGDMLRAGLELSFQRFEAMQVLNEDERYKARPHQADVDDEWSRRGRQEGTDRRNAWRGASDVWVPYSDKAWATLLLVKSKLEELASQLDHIFQPENAQAALESANLPMLLGAGNTEGSNVT